jgi:hypothetical protein
MDTKVSPKTPKESKVIAESGGRGDLYKPDRSGPQNFGGSEGVGKSSPKSGRSMRTRHSW